MTPRAAAEPAPAPVPDQGVGLPLAISRDGKLATLGAREGLVALIGVMFATPEEHWAHAPWFGLYEAVSAPRPDRDDLAKRLNEALGHLGITWASVAEVVLASGGAHGARRFDVVLAGPEGGGWEERHEVARVA